jgi:hypothetical protein
MRPLRKIDKLNKFITQLKDVREKKERDTVFGEEDSLDDIDMDSED